MGPLLSLSNNMMQNLPLPNFLRSKGQHATAKSIHCQSAPRGGIPAGPSGTCPALISLPTSASVGCSVSALRISMACWNGACSYSLPCAQQLHSSPAQLGEFAMGAVCLLKTLLTHWPG
ncbi:calcium-binding protein 39 [Platysternon megacephalum]|uniref:Calcium-binding protein 39 n=1 Tax=Platysternon megacephalum TaxID=55544 RepID=A0A4D9E4Q2_9SAUR|nr:calcium-binding protein 39 [Platysternon megacephalum]